VQTKSRADFLVAWFILTLGLSDLLSSFPVGKITKTHSFKLFFGNFAHWVTRLVIKIILYNNSSNIKLDEDQELEM